MIPALTAVIYCIGQEDFCWWLGVLAILGVGIAHLGMNLADDYFDYKQGIPNQQIRSTLAAQGSVRARMDKCSYIQSGEATIEQLHRVMWCYLGVAGAIGLTVFAAQYLMNGLHAAMGVALYAVLALALGLSYSGGPLRLGYYGLGELVIGIMFGLLNMLGVQAACTGQMFSWPMLWLGIAMACLVINIVYVHSVMECSADAQLNKMTFARLLNKRWLMIAFIAIFAIVPFCVLGVGIAHGWWHWSSLITLVTLPMAIYLIRSTYRFVYDLPRNDEPRWWMGPMGEWQQYVAVGMDWFMLRWLLARNITTYWCLLFIIVTLIF